MKAGQLQFITRDNEGDSWDDLPWRQIIQQQIAGTDTRLASHHGRREVLAPKLFDYFRPKLVVVSDGPLRDTSVTSQCSATATGWVRRRMGIPVSRNFSNPNTFDEVPARRLGRQHPGAQCAWPQRARRQERKVQLAAVNLGD